MDSPIQIESRLHSLIADSLEEYLEAFRREGDDAERQEEADDHGFEDWDEYKEAIEVAVRRLRA